MGRKEYIIWWYRFLLVLSALFLGGIWGYQVDQGFPRYFFAGGIPFFMGIVLGVFHVPGDPLRPDFGPVSVSGRFRFALELVVYGFPVFFALRLSGIPMALGYGLFILVYALLCRQRIFWLLRKKRSG